jgi:hypothetical protein
MTLTRPIQDEMHRPPIQAFFGHVEMRAAIRRRWSAFVTKFHGRNSGEDPVPAQRDDSTPAPRAPLPFRPQQHHPHAPHRVYGIAAITDSETAYARGREDASWHRPSDERRLPAYLRDDYQDGYYDVAYP